ncbi:MAG: ammonium transporter [Verrucomicrobiota bacterium]
MITPTDAPITPLDNSTLYWVVVAGILIFFMQAGFCLLELGFSRSKNCLNIVMKNLLDICISTVFFYLVGFGLMFGPSIAGFVGEGPFVPNKTSVIYGQTMDSTSPAWTFWFFQAMFVGTAVTIASGAMAERTKFIGYLVYCVLISAILYPIIGHWCWNGTVGEAFLGSSDSAGWLAKMGFEDFAGSTVVHTVGGACALAGILVVGPRCGRFLPDGSSRLIVGHNIPLAALGTFILWFGWYGFNGGAAMIADTTIGRILVATTLAAAMGATSSSISMWIHLGRPDPAIAYNGCLGGLVSVTACCHVVQPGHALLIGTIAGLISTYGSIAEEKLKIDDVVGAIPVHLLNGIWGTLCVAIFNESGFDLKMVYVQALGALVCAGTAFIGAYLIFTVIDITVGLRVPDIEQQEGLDFHEHCASAYPEFQVAEQDDGTT